VYVCEYRTHYSTHYTAYTSASKTRYIIPIYITIFLKVNPWVRNM